MKREYTDDELIALTETVYVIPVGKDVEGAVLAFSLLLGHAVMVIVPPPHDLTNRHYQFLTVKEVDDFIEKLNEVKEYLIREGDNEA